MSTISVDNARPSAGGTSYSLTSGVAKAWSCLDATVGSAVAKSSYNVSSVTDNSVGNFNINLANFLTSSDYMSVFGEHQTTTGSIHVKGLASSPTSGLTKTSGSLKYGFTVDGIDMSAAIFGDLA